MQPSKMKTSFFELKGVVGKGGEGWFSCAIILITALFWFGGTTFEPCVADAPVIKTHPSPSLFSMEFLHQK